MGDDFSKLVLGDTAISAVERSTSPRRFFGRRKKEQPPLTQCENCGAQLHGQYCGQCGQPAIDYRRSFGHVLVDVLNEFLNWDSKFFATIGLLVAKPWRLTNDFLAGHRVRYVHPLRLYLLASIIFFFAINYWAKSIPSTKLTSAERAEIAADLKKENLTADQRAKIEQALSLPNVPPDVAASVRKGIEEKRTKANGSSIPAATSSPQPTSTAEATPVETSADKSAHDRPFLQFGGDKEPKDRLGKWLKARAKEKIGEHGSNAQLFLRTLISNLPYMVLCCIPLFAFVLKILYVRKKIFYIDHLIYALHIHTFAYLAVMLIILATIGLNHSMPGTLTGWIIAVLWITFAVQIFLSIRRVYRQGWFFTIFKFFLGGFVYLIVLLFALTTTFFITLALP